MWTLAFARCDPLAGRRHDARQQSKAVVQGSAESRWREGGTGCRLMDGFQGG